MSGISIFWLLVVLIDECMNQEIIHPKPWETRPTGRSARIKCTVDQSTLQSSPLHWYKAKSGEALQRIMYFEAGSKTPKIEPTFARKFSGSISGQEVTLSISAKPEDAGIYYCALWSGDKKVFGSGTRLYVTGQAVTAPSLRTYPPSDKDGKTTMVCQASNMFPDLVKFTWQSKSSTEDWTDVADEFVVEQRDEKPEVTVTSMVIVDKGTAQNNNYRCSVKHDEKSTTALITRDVSSSAVKPNDTPQSACPPSKESPNKQTSGSLDETHSLYLFVYAYGIMLMKNAVYFGAVSIYLLKRKAGEKKDER